VTTDFNGLDPCYTALHVYFSDLDPRIL